MFRQIGYLLARVYAISDRCCRMRSMLAALSLVLSLRETEEEDLRLET